MTGTPRAAVYAGTFDPITNGHLDILRRACALFDRVIVAVADNPRKTPMFGLQDRIALIRESVADAPGIARNIEIEGFTGLLVEYTRARGVRTVIRGLRAMSDFEFEFQMAHMNRHLAPDIEMVYLMTGDESFYVSSSLVKEIAGYGGDIAGLAPAPVVRELKRKNTR